MNPDEITMIVHLGAKYLDAVRRLAKKDLLLFDAIVTSDLPNTLSHLPAADAAALEWLAAEGCIHNLDQSSITAALTDVMGEDFLFGQKAALGIMLQHIGLTLERFREAGGAVRMTSGDNIKDHRWLAVVGRENHVDYKARLTALYYKRHPSFRATPLLDHFSSMDLFHLERNAKYLLKFLTEIRPDYEQALNMLQGEQRQNLQEFYGVAFGILQHLIEHEREETESISGRTDVLEIVMEEFPIPDESVPWEQILDYRRDPDSQARLQWLRTWMKKVSEVEVGEREIRDEYQECLFAFQDHMRIHRMKMQPGGIQSLLTLPAAVIENVLRLEFTKLPEALFWTKHRKIALLEAERSAPGRELAYVVMTQQKFGT